MLGWKGGLTRDFVDLFLLDGLGRRWVGGGGCNGRRRGDPQPVRGAVLGGEGRGGEGSSSLLPSLVLRILAFFAVDHDKTAMGAPSGNLLPLAAAPTWSAAATTGKLAACIFKSRLRMYEKLGVLWKFIMRSQKNAAATPGKGSYLETRLEISGTPCSDLRKHDEGNPRNSPWVLPITRGLCIA